MDNGSQKKFISKDIVRKLGLVTTPHPQPYNIGWMKDGKELRISWQCKLTYFINPFEYEVLCDMAPLSIANALFGKPYLWDRNSTYQSWPQKVIVKIWNWWYGIPKRQPTSTVSMISSKQTNNLINHAQKFPLIMIKPQHSKNTIATRRLIDQRNSWKQQQIDHILEEYFKNRTEYLCIVR